MNAAEFNRWWSRHKRLFPSIASWVGGLDEDGQKAILARWARQLQSVSLREAVQVTVDMADDRIEAVGTTNHDREQLATTLVRAVQARRRRERYAAADRGEELDNDFTRPSQENKGRVLARNAAGEPVSMAALIANVKHLVESGRSPEEATEETLRDITWTPDSEETLRREAKRCQDCRDSGLVYVWSPVSIRAWIRNRSEPIPRADRKAVVAPCHCPAADRYVWDSPEPPPSNWKGWRKELTRYALHRYCRIQDPLLGEEEERRFREWCDVTSREAAEHRRRHPEQYGLPLETEEEYR